MAIRLGGATRLHTCEGRLRVWNCRGCLSELLLIFRLVCQSEQSLRIKLRSMKVMASPQVTIGCAVPLVPSFD